jgi:sucrose-6-phosphate hydrolase SacC (GH32 family)
LTIAAAMSLRGADGPDIAIADFETETYGAWQATGEAFGAGPAKGTLPNQMPVSGYLGERLVNSFWKGDGTTGTLTSPPFRIERRYIAFLVGGGNHPGETEVRLVVGGAVVRKQTGSNSERLRWKSWDVADLEGKTVTIVIVDEHTGGWGHINVDHIVQTSTQPLAVDDRDGALARAEASVRAAEEKAAKDPHRPTYHLRSPANWINDPNGPILHRGWYHLFYQHNPYGDGWENMHWGHWRSRDLVTWEHQPIALWPSLALGEDHCFSGCATVDASGKPLIFYTSIGTREPECWIAVPEDDDLVRWKKHPANPVLRESSSSTKLYEWRDPFVFRHVGKTYMVQGGNLNASKGGQGAVSLYEAQSDDLIRWQFKSILFVDPQAGNIECPNFFPLGGKFVLITSPHRRCDYLVGSFDSAAGKFTPERRGILDHTDSFYAPNGLEEPSGRRLLWGWVRGFKPGMGWNGCMTVPRVLSLSSAGELLQAPAPEVEKLRRERIAAAADQALGPGKPLVIAGAGDACELIAELDRGAARAIGLKVRRSSDGRRGAAIVHDGETLDVAGTKVPLELAAAKPLRLHVFVDRSVIEVYADGGRAVTTKVYYGEPEDVGYEIFTQGGGGKIVRLETWRMGSIWVR